MNRQIILVIILILIIGGIFFIEQGKVKRGTTQPINPDLGEVIEASEPEEEISASEKLRLAQKALIYQKAPELRGIAGYINTDNVTLRELKGKVVMVDFWTYSCINCLRTLPHLTGWDSKYRDLGLVIVGVHTPEFKFEEKYENVLSAVEKYGIRYPVVQDNDYQTWRAYKNRWWPRKYLIDADGFIRYDHIGEGAYEETEKVIQELLVEMGMEIAEEISDVEDASPRLKQTPELYAGSDFALPRGQNVGNDGGLRPGEIFDYSLPAKLQPDRIYLSGKWQSNTEDLKAQGKSSIMLSFTGRAVNIVAEAEGATEMEVSVDGTFVTVDQAGDDVQFEGDRAFVSVDEPRLYNVVSGDYGEYVLDLTVDSTEFSFNAFTFG